VSYIVIHQKRLAKEDQMLDTHTVADQLKITRHAETRMSQRGFSKNDVQTIVDYGSWIVPIRSRAVTLAGTRNRQMNNNKFLEDSSMWNWYQVLAWVHLRDYQYVELFGSNEVYQLHLESCFVSGGRVTEHKQVSAFKCTDINGYSVERYLLEESKRKVSSGKKISLCRSIRETKQEIYQELQDGHIRVWGRKIQPIISETLKDKNQIDILNNNKPVESEWLSNIDDVDFIDDLCGNEIHEPKSPFNNHLYILIKDNYSSEITIDTWIRTTIKYKQCLDCYVYSANQQLELSSIWEHPRFPMEDIMFRWPPIKQTPKWDLVSNRIKDKMVSNNVVVSLRNAFILNIKYFYPKSNRDIFSDTLRLKEHPLHLNFEKALKAIEDGELDIHDYSEGYYSVGLLDFMVWLANNSIVKGLDAKDLISQSSDQSDSAKRTKTRKWLISLMSKKNVDDTFVVKTQTKVEYRKEASEKFGSIGRRPFDRVWSNAQEATGNDTWSIKGRVPENKTEMNKQENN
jgi:hypothetical protein